MTALITEDYDERTVPEVETLVEDIEDPDLLEKLLEYEKENKDRKTAKAPIREKLDRKRATAADEDERPEEVTVTTTQATTGYLAGLHFERAYEHKQTEYTKRIERAIENGELRRVDV